MSQYPNPYGHGQYPGTYPPPPYPYPATGYSAPGQSSDPAQLHRDASQAAYNFNAGHIPGLGIGGTSAADGQRHPALGIESWPQVPPFFMPTQGPPQPRLDSSTVPIQSQSSAAHHVKPGPQSSGQPAPAVAHPTADVDMEEGELSEGQFEDLYEPREYIPATAPPPTSKLPAAHPIADLSQPTSAADTPDGGFYASDEESGDKALNGDEGRDRSASYSPFLSPKEGQSEGPTPQPRTTKPTQDTEVTSKSAAIPPPVVSKDAGASAPQAHEGPGTPFKTVQEAKKEAQKAILRLWPLGVKYQNYLDEGFDEGLIKSLFVDLHLELPKVAPTIPPPSQSKASQPGQDGSQPAKSQLQQTGSSAKGPDAAPEKGGKAEERKDRIARLLAAKAAKGPAPPKPVGTTVSQPKAALPDSQSQSTAPTPQGVTAPKAKAWGDKERLLQQKIAALQKSREAQKASADQIEASITAAATTAGPIIPTGPKAETTSAVSDGPKPAAPQAGVALAGLLSSPNTPQNLVAQRKRPVAADFVDYSSTAVPAKRPFAQMRQESTLIIDVSDESEDEEMDVEMEMESPVDESLPTPSNGLTGQRGPAIRDFPPLTDTLPQRQFSSPAPSVTPPGGRPNNTKRESELDLKEKAIQDMRRRIALAEAKRKVKQQTGGSVTPNQLPLEGKEGRTGHMSNSEGSEKASPQPTSELVSASLPKTDEPTGVDPFQRAQRRGRIMSLEIPRVELSLAEKMKRLEQLRLEQERLQAEIDNSVIEQQKLADELQQLDSTAEESPHTNGQGSAKDSGPLSAPTVEEQRGEELEPDLNEPQTTSTTTGSRVDQSPAEVVVEQPLSPSRASEQPVSDADTLPRDGTEDATDADGTTPMEIDSRASSLEVEERLGSAEDEPAGGLPEQISGAAQPREAVQEIEAEVTGEVHIVPSLGAPSLELTPAQVQEPRITKSTGGLTPYQSPLRYFRAYRFHPQYKDSVTGGLRSLTYSNRIDPERELCPYELTGQQCPDNCEFQHIGSIGAADDQILLELGNSDDYSSEQKGRFIQGLRELLQKFKADKVKDFDTIASGIIRYRSEFLGDNSKVLRLEGVTI
ncbi:uncharacterized protein C8A04DRAFT_11009 [Dichotomopilus funicola]|uniref:Putative zinc-finger domain-containing protein n=1 Tax=Dichotomopilus funicola TaxID=1934379 RepID=A0AAN6V524_9PEZI|nr:hypothetical protein C8A04DRAFT_11009 [Dichotomopilus funicola]